MESQRRNFFVYIVESPSDRNIYMKQSEGEILSQALSLAEINSKCRVVVNPAILKDSLRDGLREYLEELPDPYMLPVLHISAHGNEEGIQLTNGEMFSWDELIKISTSMLGELANVYTNTRFDLNFPGIGNGHLSKDEILPIISKLPDNVHIWEYKY